jgi:hypothetical protein
VCVFTRQKTDAGVLVRCGGNGSEKKIDRSADSFGKGRGLGEKSTLGEKNIDFRGAKVNMIALQRCS